MSSKRKAAVGALALAASLVPATALPGHPVLAGAASGFADVPDNSPYSQYIADLHAKGKISGYDSQHFGPDNNLTRAEFATMLVKALDVPTSNQVVPFQDLGGAEWARPFVQAAFATGVVHGYDSAHFGPDDPVTREQAAVMVWNWLSRQGVPTKTGDVSAMVAGANDWAKESVAEVQFYKLYGPEVTPSSGYQPQKNMTRAEAAALFDTAMGLRDARMQQPAAESLGQKQAQSSSDFHYPLTGNEWSPGDSLVLGKTFFSHFQANEDGTVTVTVPTLQQLGFHGKGSLAFTYSPPKGSEEERQFVINPESEKTFILAMGPNAYLAVDFITAETGGPATPLESYLLDLDGSWEIIVEKQVYGRSVGETLLLDPVLKGLGLK